MQATLVVPFGDLYALVGEHRYFENSSAQHTMQATLVVPFGDLDPLVDEDRYF